MQSTLYIEPLVNLELPEREILPFEKSLSALIAFSGFMEDLSGREGKLIKVSKRPSLRMTVIGLGVLC